MSDGDKYYEKNEVEERGEENMKGGGPFKQRPAGNEGASYGDMRGGKSRKREVQRNILRGEHGGEAQ